MKVKKFSLICFKQYLDESHKILKVTLFFFLNAIFPGILSLIKDS